MQSDRLNKRTAKIALATAPQIKYIEGLLIDCGFVDRANRNAYLTRICSRDVSYLDELLATEASKIIEELLERKNRGTPFEDFEELESE